MGTKISVENAAFRTTVPIYHSTQCHNPYLTIWMLHNSNTMLYCNKKIKCDSNRVSKTMKVNTTSVQFYSFPLNFKQWCACYFEEYGQTNVYSIGTFMPHHYATDLLPGSNTCVFNLRPARLYHVACGHFGKLCIYYNNYTII